MRQTLLTAGLALLLWQSVALAQDQPNPGTPPPASTSSSAPNAGGAMPLRNHIRAMLQREGFTDIQLMPSGFVIRAKDPNGNPVVMSVSPNSVTEISELGASGQSAGSAERDNDAQPGQAQEFVSVRQNDKLSSNLTGLDVYNGSDNIGQIKDVVLGPKGRMRAIIVSVGGVLGAGAHYVAVNPRDIQISYNGSDQKWHATTTATADQLKSAPQFQYTGRWNASKS
jgi:hypothetical protein